MKANVITKDANDTRRKNGSSKSKDITAPNRDRTSVMKDTEWERNFRKEIRHITKLLARVTDEALVLVPDLLIDEMNKRSEERENEVSPRG